MTNLLSATDTDLSTFTRGRVHNGQLILYINDDDYDDHDDHADNETNIL